MSVTFVGSVQSLSTVLFSLSAYIIGFVLKEVFNFTSLHDHLLILMKEIENVIFRVYMYCTVMG